MSFNASSTTDDVLTSVDLTGKVAVITGASGGLGGETARALASKGATVVLASRDFGKTEAKAAELRDLTGNINLYPVELDLADFNSIRSAASQIADQFPVIDILINNAGLMASPFSKTSQGLESQFGVCHVGHFLFTGLLIESLKKASSARVVMLSSGGHKYGTVDLEDPCFESREYNKWAAYGAAKTANAQFAVALNDRYQAEGIFAYAVHPGVIVTDLGRHLTEEDITFLMGGKKDDAGEDQNKSSGRGMASKMKSIEQGAATSVWAATSKELEGKGGAYLEDCSIAQKVEEGVQSHGYYSYVQDLELSKKLWVKTEQIIAGLTTR